MAAFEHQWPVTPKLIPARLASARTSVVTRRRHSVDYASSSRLAVHADAGAIQYRFGCYGPLERARCTRRENACRVHLTPSERAGREASRVGCAGPVRIHAGLRLLDS